MMSVPKYSRSRKTLYMHSRIQLVLLVQLTLCLGLMLMERTVDAAELPAELMLEGVSLLKSLEYAKEKQQHHQQSQQKPHLLHELAKRFPFNSNSAAGDTDVDIGGMQPSALSPSDISRFERELFLQSALDDEAMLAVDDVELPLEPDSMEPSDLMEHAIDYKQHQSSAPMWLQQHKSGGTDGEIASSTFLKMHQKQQKHNHNQQKQHQKHAQHLNGDSGSTNSATLAPPPSPVAEPQRRCAIEISTKLTGVCQAMTPLGAACVAGDYMDVYNQDCM